MATIQELKTRIDLHDLADKLGVRRGKGGPRANYHSPHHDDKTPSLSIYKEGRAWRDYSTNEGGSCIDLVIYVRGCDAGEAVSWLHEAYAIPMERRDEPQRDKSRVEWIAEKCLAKADRAIEYLAGRHLAEPVIRHAIKRGMLGFNDWESEKVAVGEPMHGGAAAAFIVRTMNPGHVVAVDMRYLNPADNGGVKTSTQGEKDGFGWFSDLKRLQKAHTVYLVESPINALSIETAGVPQSAAAFACRGTGNAAAIDWRWLVGKRVVVCMDNDVPFPDGHPKAGYCPGLMAAWDLHERLTALDIAAQMVDQAEWEVNDLNDYLCAEGPEKLRQALNRIEPWLIPGLPGKREEGDTRRRRIFLPFHDETQYWRFRVREDFTSYVETVNKTDDGEEKPHFAELAGFRVAAVSRVTIASAVATMTGELDSAPRTLFAVSVQTPRHGPRLLRRVLDDESLHNIEKWKKFGPVFNPGRFLRMVNILERTAHIGQRNAANFVGLCYREGKLVVNEGPDCYFQDPERQCMYRDLLFPSGTATDGRRVLEAYQATFRRNAAAHALVWALGSHLKVLLGFWPHMVMQASKGQGKSTLVKRLERTLAMTVFSGQSLSTEYRMKGTVNHTSHPVGWEELSARKQEVIDKAVALLQEAYQYTTDTWGAERLPFLYSAPVLLAGEDVPIRSLIGKVVRTDLTGRKGPLLDESLPRFPVRQWLEWLATLTRDQVRDAYDRERKRCEALSSAKPEDAGATRMAGNYAAVLLAWRYLCEFTGLDPETNDFTRDIVGEMNLHIIETGADREPWVWIVETLLSEIAADNFRHPYRWDAIGAEECLLVRAGHVMDHLAYTSSLRDKWNSLPIKSERVFRRALSHAGVLELAPDGTPLEVERRIGDPTIGNRVPHLMCLNLSKLEQYGLYATPTGLH